VIEPDEQFTITLSGATAGTAITTPSAIGIITGDEATVAIAAVSANKPEGTGALPTPFTFKVDRTGGTAAGQSVKWAVTGAIGAGGVPADAADFAGGVLPSATVVFLAGEMSRTVTIGVAADAVGEFNERFAITLSNPSSGLTLGTALASGIIQNDDRSMAIGPATVTKTEGNAGTTAYTFTVTRPGNTQPVASVNWAVAGSGGAPANAADFPGGILPSGTLSFGLGQGSETITVNIAGDVAVEADEQFTVTLSNATAGVAITTASALGTIHDNDTTFRAYTLNAIRTEGPTGQNRPFTFTIVRDGIATGTQSVSWKAAPTINVDENAFPALASAAIAADFVGGSFPSGSVTFAPNERSKIVTVNVAGNNASEVNSSFFLTLESPTNGAGVSAIHPAALIVEDENSIAQFASTEANEMLVGNLGRNFFFLGGGNDDVFGEGDTDVFFILQDAIGLPATSTISLLDFSHAAGEVLDFTLFDANFMTPQFDSFSFIGQAQFDGTPGRLRVEYGQNVAIIQGNVNNDTIADLTIEVWFPQQAVDSTWFAL